jgi:hypothetical protein
MIALCPFEEFNLRHQLRPNPNAFLHVFCGQALTPARSSLLGKIYERTVFDDQRSKPLENLVS